MNDFLQSKPSIQFSILVGKYLPRPLGLGVAYSIGSMLGSLNSLGVTKAIRSNQAVIRGIKATASDVRHLPRKVLTHAGRCFFDFYHYSNNLDKLEEIVPWTDDMEAIVEHSHQKKGYVIVAPHLSNFDIVVARIVQGGFKGKMLSYPNPGSGYKLQNKIRQSLGLDIIPLGVSGVDAEMIDYIKSGGIVATGVDRPVPGRKKRHYVSFFGELSPLPLGYITLALAAEVPIIAVSSIMLPNGKYSFRCSKPIHLERFKNKLDNIKINAERVLKTVEEFIREVPEQWLMFYPVWPDLISEEI